MIVMKKEMYFLLIFLAIVFIAMMMSDFILIRIDFDDIVSKYPIKFFVVFWAFILFRLAYCIFYTGMLLSAFNIILLKAKKLMTLFILTVLSFLFIFILVSAWPAHYLGNEYFFNYPILGRFFWELEIPSFYLIRLNYSIFYAGFLLLILNIKILKLPLKNIFAVVLLAVIANLTWFIEVLLRGWDGLYWLEYIHISLFIIGIMFLYWLTIINKNSKINNYKMDIIFYGILYALFLIIFILLFKFLFKNVYDNYGLIYSFSKHWIHYISIIFLQTAIIFTFNILVIKHEKSVINVKIACLNVFLIIIIPAYTFMSSFIILDHYITNMLDELTNLLYLYFKSESYFDPISWIKSGNIIFGFVIYECLFIAYIKQNKTKG
jgi:hypothetical protein